MKEQGDDKAPPSNLIYAHGPTGVDTERVVKLDVTTEGDTALVAIKSSMEAAAAASGFLVAFFEVRGELSTGDAVTCTDVWSAGLSGNINVCPTPIGVPGVTDIIGIFVNGWF